jgi:hypothetical protein
MEKGFSIIKNVLSARMKGGALYIAVMISVMIGVLLSLLMLLSRYTQRHVTGFVQSSQLYYNLSSAFQLAQSEYFTSVNNDRWIKNSFNDDSIRVKKYRWGAYYLINAQTKNRHRTLSQSGLYGTAMASDTGLVISDNSRPVGLSGSVVFKSNCYLPKAGIKPAYIEGQSYNAAPGNAGFTKSSPAVLPEVLNTLISELRNQQSDFDPHDSIVSFLPKGYNRTFSQGTVVWQMSNLKLSGMDLKNNVKLICQEVEIDSSCHFENILLICNKVRFKSGFKGKIHVIAKDSVIVENQSDLNYPSSLVLLPSNENATALRHITFGENCRFFGGILALSDVSTSTAPRVLVKLNAKSEVNGLIYTNNYIHLEGKINATVFSDKLLLQTPSAVYENHILSCEIDPRKYAHALIVPLIFKKTSDLKPGEIMN